MKCPSETRHREAGKMGGLGMLVTSIFLIPTEDVFTHRTALGLITSGCIPAGDKKSGSGEACVRSDVIDSERPCLSTPVPKDRLRKWRKEARS